MTIPNFRARTAAENAAFAERSRLESAVEHRCPFTALDMIQALDAAIEHGKFYTQAAQDAHASLILMRDQLADSELNGK